MSQENGPGPAVTQTTGPEKFAATSVLVLDAQCTTDSPLLDEVAARRLTMHIKLGLDNIVSNIERVVPLIEQARAGSAHHALGFPSWTAYVEFEFAGLKSRLTMAERRPIVQMLAGTGMPTRAIASVVGANHTTVARDLQRAPVADATGGRDVVGRDGKNYKVDPPLEPRKPRRRPLPDQYDDAVYNLVKAAERLQRLHADDRFPANREGIRAAHVADIDRAAEILFKAVGELMGRDGDAR